MTRSGSNYTRLVSNVLFPLHEALKGHETVRVFRNLERSQWMSAESIRMCQERKLSRFLVQARRNVEYYRDSLSALECDHSQPFSLDELHRLPILTKEIVRSNIDGLKSNCASRLEKSSTGGSTGQPLTFYMDTKRKSYDIAAKWRATCWWGVNIGDRESVVWGSPLELGAQDVVRRIRDRLFRSHLIAAFEMSENRLQEYILEIQLRRPKMIFGYPSAIDHIAAYALATRQPLHDLGVQVVFTTSECLYEHQRQRIMRTFKCGVANGYGGRDSGFIAHECDQGGMHISSEFIVVEILDDKGRSVPQGEPGEITVTNLASDGFPLIRYRTGDIGILSNDICACGRGLPLLAEVRGRTTDFVFASDGTAIHALALIYVIRDHDAILSFKIVQQSLFKTQVIIVPDKGFDDQTEQQIISGCKKRLGGDVQIEIVKTDVIPAEKSGKHRHVVSHVNSPNSGIGLRSVG